MRINSYVKKMSDGTEIWCNRWIPDDEEHIKGVIQLHHGLSEHCMRYDRLGSVLADNGYVFNAYDVRGNGHTAEIAEKNGSGLMGAISKFKGNKIVLNDLHEMIQELKNEYKGKKVFLVGHSFGSFVSQAFIENYGNEIDGCVLIGTAGPRPVTIFAGLVLTSVVRCICGPFSKVMFLAKVAFGNYNKRIENPQSEFAWLSKNQMNIDIYNMDNWSGTMLTTSFFNDMMKILHSIHKSKNMKKIPVKLPVMIMYGSDDPVGDYGKTINKLYKIYRKNGIENLEMKVYEGDRHEILNEDDKEKVENDLISWFNQLL